MTDYQVYIGDGTIYAFGLWCGDQFEYEFRLTERERNVLAIRLWAMRAADAIRKEREAAC